MYPADLLNRRHEEFVLWIPQSDPPTEPSSPYLIIGTVTSNSSEFSQIARTPLVQSQVDLGLWSLNPNDIPPSLANGIYHYWFEIQGTSAEKGIRVTDPLAYTIDYIASPPDDRQEQLQPASVIKFRDGKLWPCDIDGNEPPKPFTQDPAALPSNNHLVIYELPTSWAKSGNDRRGVDVDVGTFQDVLALFDKSAPGARFSSVSTVRNKAVLAELGINALELLPAADAKTKDEWGYATAHYFAPDYDLGSPSDLVRLINKIHAQNTRFFTDVVMAFGHDPYSYIPDAFNQFHIRPWMERNNPDSYQSHANGVLRDGYGGSSWRYIQTTQSYSPLTGESNVPIHPSWSFHHLHLTRWMTDFAVDGLRLDSVNNIANWDFVHSYKTLAWNLYNARHSSPYPSKFLVIGEELSMPVSMLSQGILNSLWNEPWQARLRGALLGESSPGDNFEWTIRKLVDCTLDNFDNNSKFTDGSQAINYITSHDIEGYRKERLYNFLIYNGIRQEADIERRAKLAFALLLTSVGIPMIFAGEEFADQMDRSVDMGKKQTDPVNYGRKDDGGWRERLFRYVAGLVKLRKRCPALGENDTEFIHVDGRIMAWRRGGVGEGRFPVVVVVNFGEEDTNGGEYIVKGDWPDRERGGWREVTQGRTVPGEWVGREPLMRWEAKVYTRWVDGGED